MDVDTYTLAPLGEVKDWAVKQFPVAMRKAVTAAADRRGMTVAEFMVRHFEMHGIDGGAAPVTRGVARPDTLATLPPSGVAELRELVTMAVSLSPADQDSQAKRLARAMVRDRLKAMRERWATPLRIAASVTEPQHDAPACETWTAPAPEAEAAAEPELIEDNPQTEEAA